MRGHQGEEGKERAGDSCCLLSRRDVVGFGSFAADLDEDDEIVSIEVHIR